MKIISVKESIGKPLAHDVTQIIPGVYKGSRYKKGYIVKEEDVEVLLSMGKEHLYVLDLEDNDVHEDEAGIRIAKAVSGENITLILKGEGKVELSAKCKGVLKIDEDVLEEFLEDDEVMFASIHQNQVVEENEVIAGTRVIPLYVKEDTVLRAEKCKNMISVKKMRSAKVGIVTTGSEIYHGRIKDGFGDVLKEKFDKVGSSVIKQVFVDDDIEMIANSINELILEGADFIAVTGGMSVDPDDVTPAGIKASGTEIISYGAPLLPGAMFLMGYRGDIPVVGLPGCVMYNKASVFDLIVPRILVGDKITKKIIRSYAQGGFCRSCKVCTFPNCGFGKN